MADSSTQTVQDSNAKGSPGLFAAIKARLLHHAHNGLRFAPGCILPSFLRELDCVRAWLRGSRDFDPE